jgi:uncharacterized iron-regulated protein
LLKLLLFHIALFSLAADPAIFETRSRTSVTWPALEAAAKDVDVIIFGEDHGDKAGHQWKAQALKLLAAKYPVTLSLEMLERDQQMLVDEFLREEISEKAYLAAGKFWPNYADAYHPLVAIAKEKSLPVVAANVPKRYANLVAKSGLEALYKIRSPYLPPLYLVNLHRQKEYEERVAAQLAGHGNSGGFVPDRQKFIDAQYLWDAAMTDAVAQAFYAHRRKVVQLNGRFHSEKNSGLTHRLRQLGLKVLVVSIFPGNKDQKPEDGDWQLADFLVLTPKKTP